MVLTVVHKCVIMLFILKGCRSSENPGQDRENITKLYELIAGAMKDDLNKVQISRRVINDSVYLIHINKLKDVNGFKMHNIVINRTDTNSTIYINNPLESKLPHPFMTLEQFKDSIVEQRMKDRKAFLRSKKVEEDRKKWADIKATAKLKSKHTLPKQIYTKAMSSKKTESIRANTKSVLEKQKYYKGENKSIRVTTKVLATPTKGIQNTKKHTTLTTKEKGTVKKLSSSTANLKGKSTLSTAKLSTAYSRMKLLNVVLNSPTEHKLVTRKNLTNIKISEQNIATILDDKNKTLNDRESTTTTKEKMAGRSGKEPATIEKHQASTVNQIDSRNSNVNAALDGESIVTEAESTVRNEVESNTLDRESTASEKESAVRNEVESTTLNRESTATEKESLVRNEVESTTLDGESTATTKESIVSNEVESNTLDGELTANKKEPIVSNEIESTSLDRESTATEKESTESNAVETTALDEGSTDIETELTIDEQLTTADENEVTNDDDEEETNPVSEDNEEFSAESSTTTTTTTTTLPPTTRERWSRPRVFMGDMTDGTSTSSSIS